MKWIVGITLLITLYAPDRLSAYEKLKEYFPNMKERHYVEVCKSVANPAERKTFLAIIQNESGFSESAYNGQDAGICQNNRVHGPKEKFMDYRVSIQYGAKYFKDSIVVKRGDMALAVAAYNAGHNADLAKYRNWSYVRRVCFKYDEIKDLKI